MCSRSISSFFVSIFQFALLLLHGVGGSEEQRGCEEDYCALMYDALFLSFMLLFPDIK